MNEAGHPNLDVRPIFATKSKAART